MTDENIKFLRLTTGDDVISEVVEIQDSDKHVYQLINPLKVVYMTGGRDGFIQVAFVPWVFNRICDNQEFTLKENCVIMITNVAEAMVEYYYETLNEFDNAAKEREAKDFANIDENFEPNDEQMEALKELVNQLKQTKGTFH